ncbi:MAG: hypothetical protein AB7D28_01030 [Candidatus Berkiella sp.]
MAKTGPQHLAIAGAKDNNCLLNCFTHSLFSLPAETLQKMAETTAFKELIDEFESYYGLEDITVTDLINLHDSLASPYDQEIMWGPVLRKYMEKTLEGLTVSDRTALKGKKELPETLMLKLAKYMAVNVTIHNSYDNIQDPTVQVVDNPIFSMVLYHSQQGGGHYDFLFPEDSTGTKARAHNDSFEEVEFETEVDGHTIKEKLKKPITSHLYDASMTTGVVERESAIKEAVASYMKEMLKARPLASFSTTEGTTEEASHVATMHSGPKAVLVARQKKRPKPEAHIATSDTGLESEPRVGVRFETPLKHLHQQQQMKAEEDEGSYQLRAKKHAKKPQNKDESADKKEAPKMPIDEATGFPKAFIERLPILFPDQEWDRDLKRDKIAIQHKTDGRNIQIVQEPQKEEVTFKSGKGGVKDMLKCAKAYEEATSVEYVLEYELKAASEEQAKKFMLKMKESGLNLHQLKDVRIQGKSLDPGKLEALIEEVIPRPKASPKPSFGSQGA